MYCTGVNRLEMEKKTIFFYCRKCRKSLRMSYTVSGDPDAAVLSGIVIKCNTHKCVRVMTCRNYTEGRLVSMADRDGKVYL